MDRQELKQKIEEFKEHEIRSCSMEVITPLYVYRMWGGKVSLEDIEEAMKVKEEDKNNDITMKGIASLGVRIVSGGTILRG